MKQIKLEPNQILSTHDFPVHNEHILRMYFKMATHNPEIIPPTPLMQITNNLPLLPQADQAAKAHNQALKTYLNNHPEIEYIMLDGSHKTTALALAKNKINALVIGTNSDIKALFEMVKTGEAFGFSNPDTIEETKIAISNHLSKSTDFQTIATKTKRMIQEQVIPQYMIDYYNSKPHNN